MLKPSYVAGFTGHRDGFDEAVVRPALRTVLEDLRRRAGEAGGQLELYCGVAEGSDTVCVEEARELQMPVHLLLPLAEEEFAQDFSSPAAWQRSAAQIARAKKRPGCDSARLAPGEARRPACYFNQGVHLLGAVDVLVAVWDGSPARGMGGTAEIVDQARRIGVPVVMIDSRSGRVSIDDTIETAFARDTIIGELNDIAARAEVPGGEVASNPDALQGRLDDIAKAEASKFRPSLVRIILLHAVAALLAAIVTFDAGGPAAKGTWKLPVTIAQLFLVSVAFWMGYRLRRRHTQQRWVRCRFACELARGLRASVPIVDPLHPAIARADPAWRRFALTFGLRVLEHQPQAELLELRDRYAQTRLSETHSDGQIRHYQEMRPNATWWWKLTGKVSLWAAALAPVAVLLSLLNKVSKHPPISMPWRLDERGTTWALVVFLPIALPLVAGAASALRQALDAGRRNERYPEMVARLGQIKARLEGLTTEYTIRAAVSRSEELLTDELLEWRQAMTRSAR